MTLGKLRSPWSYQGLKRETESWMTSALSFSTLSPSNSVKKSQPALPVAKIDDRLEQYTQAIEVRAHSGPWAALRATVPAWRWQ